LVLFPTLYPNPWGLEWLTQFLAPSYQMSYAISIDRTQIIFQVQTQAQGWVGLGFRPDLNTMKGGDIILCRPLISTDALSPNAASYIPATGTPIAECRDSKALEVGEPQLDVHIGGSNDVKFLFWKQQNGFTTAVYSRKIVTGDIWDWPITDSLQTMFAYHPTSGELVYHGPTRSSLVTINYLSAYKGPPLRVDFSTGIQIWMLVFAGIGLAQCLLMIIVILLKSEYFKFQTPEFCILICLGAIMMHIALILVAIQSPTDGMCWAQLWLFGMGFWFIFVCLFAKVFRIWWTVTNALKMKIRPVKVVHLLIPLLICCILEGVFQACWDGIAAVRPNVDTYIDQTNNHYTLYCKGNEWMWLGSVLVRACFLLFGIWISLETRAMQKSLNWSKEIALAIYTMGIFTFTLIPIGFAITSTPSLVLILKCLGYSLATIIIIFIIFWDSLKRIVLGEPARVLESSAILSSGSMSGGSASSDVSVGIKSKNNTSSVN